GGTGGDASNNYSSPTRIPITVSGTNGTGGTEFNGWHSDPYDQEDYYDFYVPSGYGVAVNLTSNVNDVLSWIILLNSTTGQYIGWSTNSFGQQSTNANGSQVGDTIVTLEVVTFNGEGYYNFTVWLFNLDADGDGWTDAAERNCGTDPDDANSVPQDTDSDGICNFRDDDDDGDGYIDTEDSFPLDSNEWNDTDYDGIGDNSDDDDDDDGWTDVDEYLCGTNPLEGSSRPTDTDNDGICDLVDDDDDGDGYLDGYDEYPLDGSEWLDTDGDGTGDNADLDDDGDGFTDWIESTCGSDGLDYNSIPIDTDQDNSCNEVDDDDDGDGFADTDDSFPLDINEWDDTDGDGIGNNADNDDDGDEVSDNEDAFPIDDREWHDTDGDGTGDNADIDDDGDSWTDADEDSCGSDSMDSDSVPADLDNDGICNAIDPDDDGDWVHDMDDDFPLDGSEWRDLDWDGIGDNADTDDDGDGWTDTVESDCAAAGGEGDPNNANVMPVDNETDVGLDGIHGTDDDIWSVDGICNAIDPDDDNDSVLDFDDVFPWDPTEWLDTDNDGIGNNADLDDDDDGWDDTIEETCDTDPLSATSSPSDTDQDGTCDAIDSADDGYTEDNGGLPGFGLIAGVASLAMAAIAIGSRPRRADVRNRTNHCFKL
ncbi:MAG: hypothetical protein QF500_04695, partial [Candidatus Thalassarchaeaceae archaeon]|nr:hypothetical protein [Candidatus Thalassarchaeaceae archaeon]